jgi:pimeloyl-ACP methyl ester carboxylesterase
MKVYFISGLAADETMFRRLSLPESFETIHLKWIPPHKGESLHDYALRLAEPIDKEEQFAVVGLSFGGMIATEIGKAYPNARVILISSIPLYDHLPVYFKWAGKLGLHHIVPVSLLKTGARIKRFFTRETSDDRRLLHTMIRNSDTVFIRWAIQAILSWDNKTLPPHYFHIHGTRDEILPLRYTHPSFSVTGGGHLMVLDRANEINKILIERLTGVVVSSEL